MEKIIVSSVLFFISAGLFLLSFRSLTQFLPDTDWLFWLEGITIVVAIIYAVVSCIIIEKR